LAARDMHVRVSHENERSPLASATGEEGAATLHFRASQDDRRFFFAPNRSFGVEPADTSRLSSGPERAGEALASPPTYRSSGLEPVDTGRLFAGTGRVGEGLASPPTYRSSGLEPVDTGRLFAGPGRVGEGLASPPTYRSSGLEPVDTGRLFAGTGRTDEIDLSRRARARGETGRRCSRRGRGCGGQR
jgi:hypothetical protein